ncbi:hypothetical protein BGW41_005446 [Actinomortierella wolfii]|nr:hypothetical protein BGW41_005446 [Actinomortierella wolfii]
MLLRITYPVTKPFNKSYSATITAAFLCCLTAVAFWTVNTKTDCHTYTSPTYDKDICQPYNLFDGVEVRQSRDGITPFPYRDTITALGKDFKYKNNTYACSNMNYYRIVLNADRSTQINYNVSCAFDDGTSFILKASTVSNDVSFAWDAEYQLYCSGPLPHHLQSLVFASNDENRDTVPIGIGVDMNDCGLEVTFDANGQILEWSPTAPKWRTHRRMTLAEYSKYKRQRASEFAIGKDMRFVVGYTCNACSRKTGWDLVLTLLTSLGAVGGIIYTVLIFIAQYLYERPSSTKTYDKMETNNITMENV